MRDTSATYCVLGAGPSGLTCVKNFLQRGVAVECLEREAELGGVWNFRQGSRSVCESTHLISSKRLTEYLDFPMPREFPPYPSHQQVLAYLKSYADRFRLAEHIRFNTQVTQVVPAGPDAWHVHVAGEDRPRTYRGVIVASGHHWDPLPHQIPGQFSGQLIHAREYTTRERLRGQRVLIVGGGNTGCDLAVEAAQHAASAHLSLRRGYHFLPKFLHGRPIDICCENMHRWHWPLWLQRLVSKWMVRIAIGRPERYGLPKPDHQLFETHPIVNSQLLYFVGHGRIQVVPDIARFEGSSVVFRDGAKREFDLVILAIGYRVRFPFLDESLILHEDGRPRLFLNAFHPEYDNLFVAGLIQPNSGLWGLVDRQAQVMAAFVASRDAAPQVADWFRRLKRAPQPDLGNGIKFAASPRHRLEVEYFSYRKRLQQIIARFERALPANLPHSVSHLQAT